MQSRHFQAVCAVLVSCALALCGQGCRRNAPSSAPLSPRAPTVVTVPTPVPLPPGGLKGIYLSGWVAGTAARFDALVRLVDRTELNAMVIDIKDDGLVSYDVEVPLAREVKANRKMFGKHLDERLAVMKAHNIFPIARIACFRDTVLAKARPDYAIQTANGKLWLDTSRHGWLNPYKKEVWDYNIDIALDAVKHGFQEVQFDYVRFPSEGDITTLRYPGKPEKSLRREQISAFLQYAKERFKRAGVWFSADVFGLTTRAKNRGDMGIGQTGTNVAEKVDYLCPMIYPSHYNSGEYNLKNPNAEPYRTVLLSAGDAKQQVDSVKTCKLRPWIQGFSLRGVTYGATQIRAQIKALNELGITEWLIWDSRCKYDEAAFLKKPVK
ncbi:MAG: putative glycoside hydrolase [Armatimonadetes bacterium]|nr:putative glycoside hydrolase [Armatimonadota bacterium]